jgi:hypothetical protein
MVSSEFLSVIRHFAPGDMQRSVGRLAAIQISDLSVSKQGEEVAGICGELTVITNYAVSGIL